MADMDKDIREGFKAKRSQRDAKLARILARPEQVERDEQGNIVINPSGEDALAKAEREAREARAAADAART